MCGKNMPLDLRGRSQRWTPRQLCVFRYLTDIRENGHLDNNADSSRYVGEDGHELFMTEVKELMRTWRRFYDGISNVLKSTPAEYYINAWRTGIGGDGNKPEGLVSVGTKRRHSISEVRFSDNVILIDEPSVPVSDLVVVQRRRIETVMVTEVKETVEVKDTVAEIFVNSVNNAFTKLKINN